MGNRFRMIVNTVEAVAPEQDLPNLPVARVLWKVHPDMKTGLAAWILAGGAHHTGYSQNLTTEYLEDFAEMAGIEFLVIDEDTKLRTFKNDFFTFVPPDARLQIVHQQAINQLNELLLAHRLRLRGDHRA